MTRCWHWGTRVGHGQDGGPCWEQVLHRPHCYVLGATKHTAVGRAWGVYMYMWHAAWAGAEANAPFCAEGGAEGAILKLRRLPACAPPYHIHEVELYGLSGAPCLRPPSLESSRRYRATAGRSIYGAIMVPPGCARRAAIGPTPSGDRPWDLDALPRPPRPGRPPALLNMPPQRGQQTRGSGLSPAGMRVGCAWDRCWQAPHLPHCPAGFINAAPPPGVPHCHPATRHAGMPPGMPRRHPACRPALLCEAEEDICVRCIGSK
jgi:hypothetical protein